MGANPPVIPLFSSNMESWVATYISGNPHVVVQKKHYGALHSIHLHYETIATLHVSKSFCSQQKHIEHFTIITTQALQTTTL